MLGYVGPLSNDHRQAKTSDFCVVTFGEAMIRRELSPQLPLIHRSESYYACMVPYANLYSHVIYSHIMILLIALLIILYHI